MSSNRSLLDLKRRLEGPRRSGGSSNSYAELSDLKARLERDFAKSAAKKAKEIARQAREEAREARAQARVLRAMHRNMPAPQERPVRLALVPQGDLAQELALGGWVDQQVELSVLTELLENDDDPPRVVPHMPSFLPMTPPPPAPPPIPGPPIREETSWGVVVKPKPLPPAVSPIDSEVEAELGVRDHSDIPDENIVALVPITHDRPSDEAGILTLMWYLVKVQFRRIRRWWRKY